MSAAAPRQTPLGELTALPETPYPDFRGLLLRGRGETRRERGKGEEGGERIGGERGKGRTVEGMGRVGPKLKISPQNYFPGAGAEFSYRRVFDTDKIGQLLVQSWEYVDAKLGC